MKFSVIVLIYVVIAAIDAGKVREEVDETAADAPFNAEITLSKIAQAEADAKELKAKAIIQRENLEYTLKSSKRESDRLAENQRHILINENRAAFDETHDRLKQQEDEHKAGVIAHGGAWREHHKTVREFQKLLKEERREFGRSQKFLQQKGEEIAKLQKRIREFREKESLASVTN